jgi:hypothetical protein
VPVASAGTSAAGSIQSVAGDSASGDPSPADLQSSNPPLFSDEGMMPSRPTWIVALIAAVIALGVGFALGWRMLDRRIRAKYGGLRIY